MEKDSQEKSRAIAAPASDQGECGAGDYPYIICLANSTPFSGIHPL